VGAPVLSLALSGDVDGARRPRVACKGQRPACLGRVDAAAVEYPRVKPGPIGRMNVRDDLSAGARAAINEAPEERKPRRRRDAVGQFVSGPRAPVVIDGAVILPQLQHRVELSLAARVVGDEGLDLHTEQVGQQRLLTLLAFMIIHARAERADETHPGADRLPDRSTGSVRQAHGIGQDKDLQLGQAAVLDPVLRRDVERDVVLEQQPIEALECRLEALAVQFVRTA